MQGTSIGHMGFSEVEHTADCAIRVWAADLSALFTEAAHGMNRAAGAVLRQGPRLQRSLSVRAPDLEGLLVAFLTELIYAQESESLGFDLFDLRFLPGSLTGTMEGAVLDGVAKPIKAVTFHNLVIRQTDAGYETEVVFDV